MKKKRKPSIDELKAAYDQAVNAKRPRLLEAAWLSKVIAERQGVLLGGLTPEPSVEEGQKPPRVMKLYRQQETE